MANFPFTRGLEVYAAQTSHKSRAFCRSQLEIYC